MLNPLWLQTFVSLVESGSFTRTAQLRFMTQPGVSQHVKKLEQACDAELLLRLGKGVELTEQGRKVYQYALTLQQHEDKLLDSLKFDSPFEGRCSIACSGALAQRIYPAVLLLQSQHPRLCIELEVAPQSSILQGIAQSHIDLGISTKRDDNDNFSYQSCGSEPLGLMLPAERADNIDSADIVTTLQSLGLIQHPDALHYLNLYFSHCGDGALAVCDPAIFKRSGRINQLSQILLPVSMGLGFTVLPASTLLQFSEAAKVAMYQAPKPVVEPLYFVQSRHRQLAARYDTLKTAILARLSN
ncbi:LysR family transcriptional regulator [Rheinheimera maricola]|uniref:LysR family transcriptional regulator n=1 Tax=Rheinheimera maricola TaxID=2793282 RepID=A0ABS7X6T9_9GAMM|nr:LysR family transcriptional regulator [Rheinheimera maricola]MBZ9610512.1 LysR family transcriptional regulator [Rheinheimera maricola]